MKKLLVAIVLILLALNVVFCVLWIKERKQRVSQNARVMATFDHLLNRSKKVQKLAEDSANNFSTSMNLFSNCLNNANDAIDGLTSKLIETKIELARQYQFAEKYSPYDDAEVMKSRADLLLLEAYALKKGVVIPTPK